MTSAKTTTSPKPLAGATPMQLRQHQVDVWQNRHNFHHVMTPGTRAAATDMAIEADHIEALEMNANDDSGREAFFAASDKLMAPDKTARESVIRDLYALVAFYVANPEFPLPEFISVHTYVPVEQVEAIAAERGTRVYGTCPQTHIDLPGTSRKVTIFAVTNRGGRI